MKSPAKRLLAALLFALSSALGLFVWDTLSGTRGLISEQPVFLYLYMFALIALVSVVLYVVGLVYAFLPSRQSGKVVSNVVGGVSVVAIVLAIYVGYLSGAVAVWHLFAAPGLVGAILLLFVHRRQG